MRVVISVKNQLIMPGRLFTKQFINSQKEKKHERIKAICFVYGIRLVFCDRLSIFNVNTYTRFILNYFIVWRRANKHRKYFRRTTTTLYTYVYKQTYN